MGYDTDHPPYPWRMILSGGDRYYYNNEDDSCRRDFAFWLVFAVHVKRLFRMSDARKRRMNAALTAADRPLIKSPQISEPPSSDTRELGGKVSLRGLSQKSEPHQGDLSDLGGKKA